MNPLWVVGIGVVLMFAFIVLCAYPFELKWTGLVKSHHFHIHIEGLSLR